MYYLFTVLRPAQKFFTYIAGEGLQNLRLCPALRAFEQGGMGLYRATSIVTG
jgi:hypothetical protein